MTFVCYEFEISRSSEIFDLLRQQFMNNGLAERMNQTIKVACEKQKDLAKHSVRCWQLYMPAPQVMGYHLQLCYNNLETYEVPYIA